MVALLRGGRSSSLALEPLSESELYKTSSKAFPDEVLGTCLDLSAQESLSRADWDEKCENVGETRSGAHFSLVVSLISRGASLCLLSLRSLLLLSDPLQNLALPAHWRTSVYLIISKLSDHPLKNMYSLLLEMILVVVYPAQQSGNEDR